MLVFSSKQWQGLHELGNVEIEHVVLFMALKRSPLKSQVQLPKHRAQGICLTALNKVL